MTPAAFRQRARHEALRYGSDPWIFVRELLQNARDAGAGRVAFSADESGGISRIVCDDDGAGMTFEHARRYLFALYASSKERDRGAAGRFGVGFWAVLRFEPSRLVVRSWPAGGTPWEIELDGELTRMDVRTPSARPGTGTEIVLERDALDGDLARRVRDAAWQSARFLLRVDDRSRALDVRVNGEAVNAPFDLPAPSASFRKGRLRGVVALGAEARVELFAKGLRVRAASTVSDLLSVDGSSGLTRVRFPALADGVAPQAILDGEDVEPLLARADVRETPALRRLVALAEDELRRLVERQLDAARPRSWRRRAAPIVAGVAAGLVLLGLAGVLARRLVSPPATNAVPAVSFAAPLVEGGLAFDTAYRDFHLRYAGPRVEQPAERRPPVALRYEPRAAFVYFAALVLDRPFDPPPAPIATGAYEGPACDSTCLTVQLRIDDGPGSVRVPVPTGFRIDPEQVRLDGRAVALRATAAGEPLVRLTARSRGLLTYGVRPAADPQWMPRPAATTPALLAEAADEIGLRPAPERLEAATDWVRAHIAYSASDATVEQHRRARAAGHDALAAALEVGAADCDVQNAVLTTLLQAVDVPARLAIGYVGADGAALTPPHAWVEVRAGTGWKVVDASEGGAPAGRGPTRARVTVPQSGAAQAAGRAGESEVRAAGIDAAPPRPAFAADRRALVWGASGLAALTAALAGLMLTRTRRVLRVGPRSDIAALLRGALERPEAFRHVPALYRRPLVPRIDGPLLSLEAVARLSNDRRLFRSTTRSPLARRAAASGAVVVDAASREGRTAADALGAVDLDEWDLFLRGARRTPLLDAVEKRMGRLGERWQLRAAPGIGAPAVLDLATTQGPARIVVLDGQAPWLLAAEARSPRRRAEATFVIVDRLADAVRLPPDDRRRLLASLALEALREAAGTGDPRA